MKTISIINLKGGVGKTTTTIELADMLAQFGHSVLVIDADQQANLTSFYGYAGEDCNNLATLLKGEVNDVDDLVYDTRYNNVYLVPGSMELAECDIAAVKGNGSVRVIRDFVEAASEDRFADYCLIDCPPGFTAASVAAIYASDEVIIPTTPDLNAISGMAAINSQIWSVRDSIKNIPARVLITAKRATQRDTDIADQLWESPLRVFDTPIRWSSKVSEAMDEHKTLREYSPRCIAKRCYDMLMIELTADWKVGFVK